MSEKDVLERRIRNKKKKMLNTPIQLSPQQEETIQELLCGHRRTFDSAFYRFSGFRVCIWLPACLRCFRFKLSEWLLFFFFFSPWTETSFLWVRTASLKASPRMLAPSLPPSRRRPPPPVSVVPSKHKRPKRPNTSEKAVFLLLFHMWLTSQLTWSRTSLVSPKVFRTSGKCLPQCIFKYVSEGIFYDYWPSHSPLSVCHTGLLQVFNHRGPNCSVEGSHVWSYADPLQHGVQRKKRHLGMWPYCILYRWRCTR